MVLKIALLQKLVYFDRMVTAVIFHVHIRL